MTGRSEAEAEFLAALERSRQDEHINALVAAAPKPTPAQMAVLRRLFNGPPEHRSRPAYCQYCGRQIDARRRLYVVATDLPDYDPQLMDEHALFCGQGCGRAMLFGGVTKVAAARRPEGWF